MKWLASSSLSLSRSAMKSNSSPPRNLGKKIFLAWIICACFNLTVPETMSIIGIRELVTLYYVSRKSDSLYKNVQDFIDKQYEPTRALKTLL